MITAIRLVLEKRVKFGVAVPPDTNDPMTRPTPAKSVREPLFCAKIAFRPPPCEVARIME